MPTLRGIRNGLFGAAIAAALGFGAVELTAATRAQPCAAIPCSAERACDACCQAFFPGPLTDGFCGPDGQCRCAV